MHYCAPKGSVIISTEQLTTGFANFSTLYDYCISKPMFETPRLRLRRYQASDEEFFVNLFNDYDVVLNTTTSYVTPMTQESVAVQIIGRLCKSTLFVVAESKETGVPIGFCHVAVLVPLNQDGELGIAVGKSWQGKGFGTEIITWIISYSFKSLGLRRLSLSVFASNPGAVALYEHVGFKHEGRKREAMWKEGEWVDFLHMGLLAKEYYHDATADSSVLPVPLIDTQEESEMSEWIVLS